MGGERRHSRTDRRVAHRPGMDQEPTHEPEGSGVVPSPRTANPAAASQPDDSERLTGVDRGGTGEPVGENNIREGRVRGTMVPSSSTEGGGPGG
jgi:hypothetical protein